MPQDLPGFYFDVEKNRYFPIKFKGTIRNPSSSSSSASSSSSSAPKPSQVTKLCQRTVVRTSKLLQGRELYGNVISHSKGKCNFREEFQKNQASQPVAWKYRGTEKIADGALEQFCSNVETIEGQTETDVLLAGGVNGSLNFCEVGKVGQNFDYGVKCIPDHVWPLIEENQVQFSQAPGQIWRPVTAPLQMSSNISCLKLFAKYSQAVNDGSKAQHALITTLGSETCGGSVYVLNLAEPLNFNPVVPTISQRMHELASFNCTIWTADCSSTGRQAVIGTNRGAALVDLEIGMASWVCHSKSDILSQQLDQSGNVVLCGLRNGAIVTVDVRKKREGSSRTFKIPLSPSGRTSQHSRKKWFELNGNLDASRTICMASSISCLVSLKSYNQYFLASSMDGSVKLYDHRQVQRGAIQCYEGHVNSHTRIQLGVDPSERFVMSGGEDCNLRIWSIKSGELLFEGKFSNSVPLTMCWQRAEGFNGTQDGIGSYEEYPYRQNDSWGAWLGTREGLYRMLW